MVINLYLENKDNLLQTEIIDNIDSLNIDHFRMLVMRYLMDKNLLDIKYNISVSKENITNKTELNIIFENDISLLRELKLKRIFTND